MITKQELWRLERIGLILLAALTVVEGFFLWLVLFPAVVDQSPAVDTPYQGLASTRQVLVEPDQTADQLAEWQAFAAELEQRYTGQSLAVVLSNLGEPAYSLAVNADQQFIAASTYKLFAAYTMFQAGDPPDCLDDMIIYSDNDCPLSYLEGGGWRQMNQDAARIGAEQTWFDDTTHTTAHDLTLLLEQLYDGDLLPAAETERLLSDMKQQIYREGIPSGIPEAEVADKVGFLDGLLHDAGIVYSPNGDFVLVILTDGYSWQTIADLAREIYNMLSFL